jgi:hypothetical protein
MKQPSVLRSEPPEKLLGAGRGRPRKINSTLPAHIDQRQIPKWCYWDRRSKHWYTVMPGYLTMADSRVVDDRPKRIRIASATATLADLYRVVEAIQNLDVRQQIQQENSTRFNGWAQRQERSKLDADGRRQRRNQAKKTPWADSKAIRALYVLARELSQQTGARHEVDHVIPLIHPLVCGLHVENNMRVIVHDENHVKRNAWKPELL